MKPAIYKTIPFIASGIISLPLLAFAQQGIVPCNGPDCDFGDLVQLVNNIINLFLAISVSIAAISFAYGGALILLNPGNSAKREQAKGIFKKTIIGMIIVLTAWLIVFTIVKALVNPATGALRFLGR